jgi:uncharacterized membrane protein
MAFKTKNTFITNYKLITIFILGILYINIGITHFTNPDFFLVIVPDYLPYHLFIVYVSGLLEIILGFMLLFKKTRKYAGIGLVFLLILVFPANIFLYQSSEAQSVYEISKNKAFIRMFFQAPLILLAFWHSLPKEYKYFDALCGIIFIPTILYFITLA